MVRNPRFRGLGYDTDLFSMLKKYVNFNNERLDHKVQVWNWHGCKLLSEPWGGDEEEGAGGDRGSGPGARRA